MTYELWDKQTNLILPDGNIYKPEAIMSMNGFGFTRFADTVLGYQGQIVYEIQNLDILKSMHNITESDPKKALTAIEKAKSDAAQTAAAAENEPTAEERIAAALEYQNLLSM